MAGWRRAVELAMTAEEIETLTALSRSRTEAARRVERAQMLLAYRQQPSFFAVGQKLGVHHQTVQRCVERALAYGALAALDDRPRPGKEPTITPEAKAWLVSLACDKAKEHGYPHELWTTRLLARHARERGPAAGHESLAHLVQGTVCKILGQEDIKPPKVRYYLERRDRRSTLARMTGQKPRRPQLVRIAVLLGLIARQRYQPGFRFRRDRRLLARSRSVVEGRQRAIGQCPLDAALDRLMVYAKFLSH